MMNGQAPGSVGPIDGRQSVGNAPEGIKHSPARECFFSSLFLPFLEPRHPQVDLALHPSRVDKVRTSSTGKSTVALCDALATCPEL